MTPVTEEWWPGLADQAQTELQQFDAPEGCWAVIVPAGDRTFYVPVTVGGDSGPMITTHSAIAELGGSTPTDWDQGVTDAGFKAAETYEDGRMRWYAGNRGCWLGRMVRR